MLEDKYLEKLGLLMANTFDIKGKEHEKIGRVVQGMYQYLKQEQERDLRDKYNGKQDERN